MITRIVGKDSDSVLMYLERTPERDVIVHRVFEVNGSEIDLKIPFCNELLASKYINEEPESSLFKLRNQTRNLIIN